MSEYDSIVIGGGHNGLVCACYLARAGRRVLVLEMADRLGGAVHTAATIHGLPDYRFDTCSVVHNMINMTTILDELRLAQVGLQYIETDPFVTSFLPDGAAVPFYRSADRTCQAIARYSPRDADAYRACIRQADPVVEAALAAFRSSGDGSKGPAEWGRRLRSILGSLRRNGPVNLATWLTAPYGTVLAETFASDYARAGCAAMAAHATVGPHTPGGAFFIFWQAAYHRYGNWHAKGGSGALAQALARRLAAWGGDVRTLAPVAKILVTGRVRGVQLADGERIAARHVVAAINPQTALLRLLEPDRLPPRLVAQLRARHRSNAVQFVVHAALDRLPPWPAVGPDDASFWNGMQSIAGSVEQVEENFREAEAGLAPSRPAVYVFTPSAIDTTVAPTGRHTAYIACASYPARFRDGSSWHERAEGEAHRLLAAIEDRAPGFRAGVRGLAWRDADDWEREIGLLGGHPMHLDLTQDQLGPLRPLPGLGNHRTPIPGLYVSGAGTAPSGGVSGVPGRAAAKAVLAQKRDR